VVKLTLLGSVIGNLLLVMGSAFIAGGLLHSTQSFNQQGINVNCGLLILSGGAHGCARCGAAVHKPATA
jgi:Ca2+:H+ antiporter